MKTKFLLNQIKKYAKIFYRHNLIIFYMHIISHVIEKILKIN